MDEDKLKPCPFCGAEVIPEGNSCTELLQELVDVLKEQNNRLLEIEKNLNDLKNIFRFWSNSVRRNEDYK